MAYKPPKQTIFDNDLKNVPSNEAVFEALKLKLPKPSVDGTNGQLLARGASADDTSWVNPPSAGFANPMTTQGDIIVGGAAGAATRLGLGTVNKVAVSDGTTVTYQYAGLGGGAFGTNNVILGRDKPTSLSGTANIIIGSSNTANSLSTGVDNVILGTGAANLIQTGNASVVIGVSALAAYNQAANAGAITAIGYQALTAATTITNTNPAVALGYQAAYQATTATGSISIGYRSNRLAGDISGLIAIGNSAGNGGSGNVAIGGSALTSVTGNNNLGIGGQAATPLTSGRNNVILGGTTARAAGFGYAGVDLTTGSGNVIIGYTSSVLANATSSAIAIGFNSVAASNECAIGGYNTNGTDGSLGAISTVLLGRGGGLIPAAGAQAVTVMTQKATGTDIDISAASLTLAGSRSTGNKNGSPVIISTAPAGGSGTTLNAHVERMRVTAAGNVGIGTSTPAQTLDVNGATQLQGNLLFSPDATHNIGAQVYTLFKVLLQICNALDVSNVTI